jgi:transcriptional regulator with XRE-family HTH domain
MRVRLRYWRERKLLTQEALAEKAGVSAVTIRRIERENTGRLSTLNKLAAALEIRPEDLVVPDEIDQDRPPKKAAA